ncbi:hypothetical protein HELRODRAFT_168471 [Helobdella robusta]|uniref:VPS9 domain-containing protein n=1 Tax=Helobdella robusta TaxID=6412 RepID=T1F0M0_HELRO|nr:hypothetical protein HELRODRAFT_168471 [Helobdella robusta]ESO09483.1 hypothetical protein HELRODRAFT_168471 [Helobdella robusta]
MKLRLIIEKCNVEISNVKLKEGYIPSIFEYTCAGEIKSIQEKPAEFLEPAIWFKILLMDVLTIDCNIRTVYWTPVTRFDSVDEDPDKVANAVADDVDELNTESVVFEDLYDESFKMDDECVDYFNYLDEVYDVLPSMLIMYRDKKMTKEEFYKSLIKLIHVNVLPNVRLGFENLDLLKKCFHTYTNYMKRWNNLIGNKTSQLSELKATKFRERKKFLQRINSTKDIKIYDKLLNLLEVEYKKDLERASYDFKKLHEDYMRSVCDAVCKDTTAKLSKAVESRKEEIISMNNVLDNIRRLKSRSSFSKMLYRLNSPARDDETMQNMYLTMKEAEDILQKKIYTFMDKKLMLLTVYENMRNVIQELMEGYESYGVDFDRKSRMKSNILAETSTSLHWKSLPELVNIILCNAQHDITKDHNAVVEKVRHILMETLKKFNSQSQYNSIVPKLMNKHATVVESVLKKELNECTSDVGNSCCNIVKHNSNVDNRDLYHNNNNNNESSSVSLNKYIFSATADDSLTDSYETLHLTRSPSLNNLLHSLDRAKICRCNSVTSSGKFSEIGDRTEKFKRSLMSVPSFKSYLEEEFVKNDDFSYLVETIQQVKPMIADHFKSICTKLTVEIDKSYDHQNFRKIWVIYENYFYENILSLILELYRAQFASKTEVLTDWIFKMTLNDLDMADTKTLQLLLVPQNDSYEAFYCQSILAGSNYANVSNVADSPAGSTGSLINAIIDGLTTEEDVFYDDHQADSYEKHVKANVCKKLKNVATAVDKVLKIKMKAKIRNKDSGFELSGQMNNEEVDDDDINAGLTHHKVKPQWENQLSSTSLKPLTFDIDKYISESSSRSIRMKPIVMNRFLKAYSHLKIALSASTPLVKTHHLCRCLKEVSNQMIKLYREVYRTDLMVCNDELMDGLIVLICNLENKEIVSDLYVQLQLMTDTLADLFEAGEYRFALVMFQGVCQYLQDKTMMKKNRLNSTS